METCNICFEDISCDEFKTSCEHKFHNKCLTQWVLSNETCPLCRKNLIQNNYESNYNEEIDNEMSEDDESFKFEIDDGIYNIQDDVLFFRIMDTIHDIEMQLYENPNGETISHLWNKIENDIYGFNYIFKRKNLSVDIQFLYDYNSNTVYIDIFEIKLYSFSFNKVPNWKCSKIHNILYSINNNNSIPCY